MMIHDKAEALIKLALKEDEKEFADELWHAGMRGIGMGSEFIGETKTAIKKFLPNVKSEAVKKEANEIYEELNKLWRT